MDRKQIAEWLIKLTFFILALYCSVINTLLIFYDGFKIRYVLVAIMGLGILYLFIMVEIRRKGNENCVEN